MTLTVGTPDAFACLTNLAVALGMLGVAVTAGRPSVQYHDCEAALTRRLFYIIHRSPINEKASPINEKARVSRSQSSLLMKLRAKMRVRVRE